ncbi:MFS transporter [Neptunitalea lumnitzerae]|uniref:MFS transporter n=1 Tax=Neptunitalea lumnitzerae TaxID=2965509 RepID=A0ABQ5MH37_9FLAO|nr:MFS transporter [Neptunitalea sp. Y10]GLB48719.1 MFS transporter [Neptunitalea sp. Y10]
MEKHDAFAALRYKEFNVFLTIRFALIFAWTMQFVIIQWEVYHLTKDPLSLGYVGLVEVIPAVCMALFAGHLVDSNEKRGLLLKVIAGFSVISLAMFLLTWPAINSNWPSNYILYGIYGCVFLGGFVRSFVGPTVFALLGLIVPRKIYPNAATWNSSIRQVSLLCGAAAGGFTIHLLGTHGALAIVFFCVLVAFLFALMIKKRALPVKNTTATEQKESVFYSLAEGLKFVLTNKIILGVLALDMFAVLFGGARALLPIFAEDILKVGSKGFGILEAAPAVGALITMVICAFLPLYKNTGKKLLIAVFGFGVSIIMFGVSTNFYLSVFALFLSGVTDGISMVIRQTILQLRTPDHMRGRVASVNSIFISSSNEMGSFESGFTAKLMGTVVAVIFGGCMTLLTVVGMAGMIPPLRKLDLQKDVSEHQDDGK